MKIVTTVLTALALLLAGCSSSEPAGSKNAERATSAPADVDAVETDDEEATQEEPEPVETETPPAEESQRGNLVKQIGETAGMYLSEARSDTWLEFQITDVVVGGECTEEFAEPPENGQFLFVEISASTASEWPPDMQGLSVDFGVYDWSIIGEDGLTEHNLDTFATYGCLPDGDLLPAGGIGPGENVVGTLVLDTANPTGVLVYQPWYLVEGGWEWEY